MNSQQSNQCWCHICKKQFELPITQDIMKCRYCAMEFCEIIDLQNDPRTFIPYGEQTQQQQQPIQQTQSRQQQTVIYVTQNQIPIRLRSRGTVFDNLLQMMFPQTQFQAGQSLESLIEFISRNDPNRYGSPPASQKIIDSLPLVTLNKECCTVCQEEYNSNSAIQMPCQHHFHPDCLIPWLKQHNSCPVCRYELLTDDEEYNQRKNLK